MYRKPGWAKSQIRRETGLIEDVCVHGIGHPNKDFISKLPKDKQLGWSIHGCDGCCYRPQDRPNLE